MSDDLLMVDSTSLSAGADQLRSTVGGKAVILRNGVKANAAQLETASRILREGPKSVITSARVSGAANVRTGYAEELPGFIHVEQQETPEVLVLQVGILSATGPFHIDRSGEVVKDGGA